MLAIEQGTDSAASAPRSVWPRSIATARRGCSQNRVGPPIKTRSWSLLGTSPRPERSTQDHQLEMSPTPIDVGLFAVTRRSQHVAEVQSTRNVNSRRLPRN
ncbi:Uncharacterised protein [Mycobacteroides abscessus subsp. abscessus]|nr:Uncharacterised protein [Mycobacteroides abscessus subsp. abscessus]SKX40466.1 Uncharacterised protein [Mycobacteroides abscessus subsp. abscessus]